MADEKYIRDRLAIADRVISAYLSDRAKIAAICDETLDRSGALLGYLRNAAGHVKSMEAKE